MLAAVNGERRVGGLAMAEKRRYWKLTRAVEREIMDDGTTGRCLGCGAKAHGVEPDARKYECSKCGAHRVYGLEELVLMGRIH